MWLLGIDSVSSLLSRINYLTPGKQDPRYLLDRGMGQVNWLSKMRISGNLLRRRRRNAQELALV
jgi:hypothetical protein